MPQVTKEETCPRCGGRGKEEVSCRACGGSTSYSTEYHSCYSCNGRGRVEENCSSCYGRGKITHSVWEPDSSSSSSSYDASSSSYTSPSSSGSSSTSSDPAFDEADRCKAAGNWDGAIAAYTRLINKSPKIGALYGLRGGVYFNKEDYDRAITDYTKSIELMSNGDNSIAKMYNNRGIAYGYKGEQDKEIADYKKVISLDPSGKLGQKAKKYIAEIEEENAKSGSSSYSGPEWTGFFKQGMEAYNAGDFKKAFELILKAAEQGDVIAMSNIGGMYKRGEGVKKDLAKALEWRCKAGEKGDVNIQHELGTWYFKGNDEYSIEKDAKKAAYWWQKATDQGFDASKNILEALRKQGKL